ncbi:sensor histidine kinase [Dactylosporangium sp. CS-047395]|uniref:sensor histidine kinase n=1 Tax=Dactylosporangium sp. CS-047395 TaxID=3239936 RepID=UPI003D913A4C
MRAVFGGTAAALALPLAALAAGLGSTVIAGPDRLITTYAATGPVAATAELGVGWALLVAGSVTWLSRGGRSVAVLVAAIGTVWLSPVWAGWYSGPLAVRSVAMLLPPMMGPLLIHLTLTAPAGRLTAPTQRRLVAIGYAVAGSVSLGHALVYDPFFDPDCWRDCTGNTLLVRSMPAAAALFARAGLVGSVTAAAVVVIAAIRRVSQATVAGRRLLGGVLAATTAAGLAEALYAAALLRDPAEDPRLAPFMTVFLVRAAGCSLIALGLGWALQRRYRSRSAVARLITDLGASPPPGALRRALATMLRDEHLDIGYRLPGSTGYVDADGGPFDPAPGPGQATTAIRRHGEPLAILVHDRSRHDEHDLSAQLGSATRLAIDNERLRASLLARLADLRASRARIVMAADQTRRRLERDLHDGAQQRVLAVTAELHLARSAARAGADAALIDKALIEIRAALADLREIAHGIFPTILEEAGLEAALLTLAETAAAVIDIDEVVAARLPTELERAVYAVVQHTAGAAPADPVRRFRVRVACVAGRVVVTVDGVTGEPGEHVHDRVLALGGQVTSDGQQLRAELPCDWS